MRQAIFGAAAACVALAGTANQAGARPHYDDASAQDVFANHFSLTYSRHVAAAADLSEPRKKRTKRAQRSTRTARLQRADRDGDTTYSGSRRVYRSARKARVQRAYREEASYSYSGGSYSAGPRPRRWCGWWMRTQRGGGPHLNLARNWARWGSPSSPQVGAVVVWRSHVGEIVGRASNGKWIVRSGNDGGRVRSRARSLAGVIAVRM